MRSAVGNLRLSFVYALLLLSAGLLSGCGAHTNGPLPDPGTATIDGRLLGVWTRTEINSDKQKTETTTFRISRSSRPDHPGGVMMTENTLDADGDAAHASSVSAGDSQTRSYFVTCQIPDPSGCSQAYLSVFLSPKDGISRSSECLLEQYSVKEDSLTLYECSLPVGADLRPWQSGQIPPDTR